jgi:hypothetical protein
MKKLIVTTAALLALAIPTVSSAAGSPRWVTYPTCTATTSALTCTGRAAGVQPQSIVGLGSVQVVLFGQLLYTCLDPYYQTDFSGRPPTFILTIDNAAFHNGRAFSIDFVAPYAPPTMNANQCFSGLWARPDVNYYNVDLKIGWGYGGAVPIEALDAPIGTVLAQ